MCIRGSSATIPDELFIAPFSIPTSIPRFYFVFQKPIETSPGDLKSEGRCQQLYGQVGLLITRPHLARLYSPAPTASNSMESLTRSSLLLSGVWYVLPTTVGSVCR